MATRREGAGETIMNIPHRTVTNAAQGSKEPSTMSYVWCCVVVFITLNPQPATPTPDGCRSWNAWPSHCRGRTSSRASRRDPAVVSPTSGSLCRRVSRCSMRYISHAVRRDLAAREFQERSAPRRGMGWDGGSSDVLG